MPVGRPDLTAVASPSEANRMKFPLIVSLSAFCLLNPYESPPRPRRQAEVSSPAHFIPIGFYLFFLFLSPFVP